VDEQLLRLSKLPIWTWRIWRFWLFKYNSKIVHENYDFFYGMEADLEELTETHNYIPGAKDDVNLRGYYTA